MKVVCSSLVLLALLVACGGGGDARKGGPPATVVRVQEVQPERIPRVLELTGTLGGEEEITLAAEVEGRVERIAADLGDRVAAGGVVVALAAGELRLRAAQAEAEYLQAMAKLGIGEKGLDAFRVEDTAVVRRALADLDDARRALERGDELLRRQLASQGEHDVLRTRFRMAEAGHQAALEQARSDHASALARRAVLGLARKKLADASITSPVAGAVARRLVAPGEYVKIGQPVAQIVVLDPLKLRGEAAERWAGLVVEGMPARIRVDALGRTHEGKVSRVGPAVSATTRTFPLEALLENDGGELSPGLFARAEIQVGRDEEVFAVPETAVSSIAGVVKVFVEVEGKARERKVELLRKRGSDALVVGELRAGDRVILTAIARLFDGADVQVDPPAAPPAAAKAGDAPVNGG